MSNIDISETIKVGNTTMNPKQFVHFQNMCREDITVELIAEWELDHREFVKLNNMRPLREQSNYGYYDTEKRKAFDKFYKRPADADWFDFPNPSNFPCTQHLKLADELANDLGDNEIIYGDDSNRHNLTYAKKDFEKSISTKSDNNSNINNIKLSKRAAKAAQRLLANETKHFDCWRLN